MILKDMDQKKAKWKRTCIAADKVKQKRNKEEIYKKQGHNKHY